MKEELLSLIKKYKIPLTDLNKEVLVDEELLEEAAIFLDAPTTAPFAFPGFIFKFLEGTALENDERKLEAVTSEYGVPGELWEPPKVPLRDETIFLEPDYRYARDVLAHSLIAFPKRMVSVTRESVLLSLIAEPGWREYSPITVIASLFYEVNDAFRVETQKFFPPGKSSMGMAFLSLKRPYPRAEGFLHFLKNLFTQRKKKVKIGGVESDKRVDQMDPEELLELFETTFSG
ncbi:MAG: hypothetical protein GXO00_01960 [Candidatus Diapherotrites archaeon]|nr:hypothetical protein [Candidatus Diapherotrites archaeon]